MCCYRYIELNPVRAGMVRRPEQYRWSSYGCKAWGDAGWLTPHDEYLRLGDQQESRGHAYRELFRYQISDADLHLIRQAAHYSQPVGDERSRIQIEQRYGVRMGRLQRRRPRKDGEGDK